MSHIERRKGKRGATTTDAVLEKSIDSGISVGLSPVGTYKPIEFARPSKQVTLSVGDSPLRMTLSCCSACMRSNKRSNDCCPWPKNLSSVLDVEKRPVHHLVVEHYCGSVELKELLLHICESVHFRNSLQTLTITSLVDVQRDLYRPSLIMKGCHLPKQLISFKLRRDDHSGHIAFCIDSEMQNDLPRLQKLVCGNVWVGSGATLPPLLEELVIGNMDWKSTDAFSWRKASHLKTFAVSMEPGADDVDRLRNVINVLPDKFIHTFTLKLVGCADNLEVGDDGEPKLDYSDLRYMTSLQTLHVILDCNFTYFSELARIIESVPLGLNTLIVDQLTTSSSSSKVNRLLSANSPLNGMSRLCNLRTLVLRGFAPSIDEQHLRYVPASVRRIFLPNACFHIKGHGSGLDWLTAGAREASNTEEGECEVAIHANWFMLDGDDVAPHLLPRLPTKLCKSNLALVQISNNTANVMEMISS